LPAIPGLLLAAVAGGRWLYTLWRRRQRRPLLLSMALLVALFALVLAPKTNDVLDDEYFKLGYAHHIRAELGQAGQAERAYLTALTFNRDNLSVLKNLSLLYEKQGRRTEAIRWWQRVAHTARRRRAGAYRLEALRRLRRLGQVIAPQEQRAPPAAAR
jgi:tetratricopeptide (TPR) repeat protein